METKSSVVMSAEKNEKEFIFILHPEATYGEAFDACVEIMNGLVEMQRKAVENMKKKDE